MSKTSIVSRSTQLRINQTSSTKDQLTGADWKKELSDITDKFETRIAEKETKTTEILAIFITLFTFISVNINIFTRVTDIQSVTWFMLIITMSCLVILAAMFLLISHKINWRGLLLLIISLLALFFLLISTRYFPGWNIKLNDPTAINNIK